MANQLSVAEVQSILILRQRGWSNRRIARELGIHRETVGRYVSGGGGPGAPTGSGPPPKPATAPTGSDSKPATAPTGSTGSPEGASVAGGATPGRAQGPEEWTGLPRSTSGCESYRQIIQSKLEAGLSAVRIHRDLLEIHGQATPSYYSVRRFVRRLNQGTPLPFRRMECPPGSEAQVDFGRGAPVIDSSGRRRYPHVLRVVLSHSRKGYSEVVMRQSDEEFIRCLENAFHHFGGTPATLVLDNLKAAVSKADWFDPQLNPKFQSFCAHYGIAPLPTKPYTPRHKGKVERGIAYVQDNALKGRVFTGLQEQNRHLVEWETTVADTRIHGTTRKQVGAVFEEVERAALKPLPPERFPSFQEGHRVVHRDGHVEVAGGYYSVPPEYLGRQLWVRWDSHMVRIFDARMVPIATHARTQAGRFSTLDPHIPAKKVNGVERGAVKLLQEAGHIGDGARRWAQSLVEHRGVQSLRVLQGLLSLRRRYPIEQLDRVCGIALGHGCLRLRTIRTLLARDPDHADRQMELPGFLDEHPIIRPMNDYGVFVHESFLQPLESYR